MTETSLTQGVIGATDSRNRSTLMSKATSDCVEAWLREAEDYSRKGIAPEAANTLRRCAGEIGAALQVEGQRKLTLSEAAEVSNYSVEHLGRMVRQGDIPNAGRKGKPAVRQSDLPRRPKVVRAAHSTYDVMTDARSIRSRGRRVT